MLTHFKKKLSVFQGEGYWYVSLFQDENRRKKFFFSQQGQPWLLVEKEKQKIVIGKNVANHK